MTIQSFKKRGCAGIVSMCCSSLFWLAAQGQTEQAIPLLGEEGWPRHQTLEGADGVVIPEQSIPD